MKRNNEQDKPVIDKDAGRIQHRLSVVQRVEQEKTQFTKDSKQMLGVIGRCWT
jgi:hypothetical protein